jgi:hypothetical protein
MISQDDYERFKRRGSSSHRNQPRIPTEKTKPVELTQSPRQDESPLMIDRPIYRPNKEKRSFHLPYVPRLVYAIAASLLLVIVIALGAIHLLNKGNQGPIPSKYTSSVTFPVYYPLASKLPSGYYLNKASYSLPAKDVLVYSIDFSNNQHLDVSLQQQPSLFNLNQFIKQHMPLNNSISTTVGKATIGDVNNHTVVSLPTNNTWIIVSGPINTSQTNLQQVLNSLTKQ